MSAEKIKAFEQHQARVTALASLVIVDAAQAADAVNGLALVLALRKTLDADRLERVDPLTAQVGEINAEYAPALGALKAAEDSVRDALVRWLLHTEEPEEKRRRP